ncbi:hypothetical protein [Aureimonas sp. AU22]|uniref:hypothetical protein n=1 Tax=Aureimonas sp. AU22 TaxID=1638162 RepID=UPI0012E3E176|nr:hypothetical protein [Aureimonas sp. AU22]
MEAVSFPIPEVEGFPYRDIRANQTTFTFSTPTFIQISVENAGNRRSGQIELRAQNVRVAFLCPDGNCYRPKIVEPTDSYYTFGELFPSSNLKIYVIIDGNYFPSFNDIILTESGSSIDRRLVPASLQDPFGFIEFTSANPFVTFILLSFILLMLLVGVYALTVQLLAEKYDTVFSQFYDEKVLRERLDRLKRIKGGDLSEQHQEPAADQDS